MKVADFEAFEPAKGFRVFVHPTRKFKTITLGLYFHQPLDDRATQLALLAPVLRRGCRGLPTMREIVIFLEELFGASMSADVVKLGERQILSFRFEVVNDRFAPQKIRALEQAMGFLWRVISQPVVKKGGLHPSYVEQEKENLRRLIQGMINDRMSYAYERCIQEMCPDEAYSRYEYGKLEEIDPVTPKQLNQLRRSVLMESPAELFVVGDVDPAKVVRIARRTFRFPKRKVRALPPTEVREGNGALREIVEKLEVEQGKLVLGCRTGITWGHADAFALIVYNGILGAYPHSKLFANVREKEGLAYATHSSLDQSKGLLFISAGIDPEKYSRCVEVVKRQMADLAAGKITDDEWNKTRATLADRVRSREDSPGSKIGSFLEMNANLHPLTPPEIAGGLERVSREDVARVAARVRPDTLFFLTRP